MSRAYRFSDFEAFLRNHSDASLSRQSGHADRLQLDRDSRESPPIERPGRDRNNPRGDSSDRFRATYRHRSREYSLRESEVKTLIEVGKFRVIPADDLARLGYRGDRSWMESDAQNLRRQGLIEQRSIEGHESYSKQVYLWVERKQIPHLRVMGRNIRFLKSELEAFRASFKQEMENA